MNRYNIKIRKVGDYRKWKDIPNEPFGDGKAYSTDVLPTARTMESAADAFIVSDPNNIVEVRINEVGSPMGHYFSNKKRDTVKYPHYDYEKGQ